jgi:putative MATE family efflux protein
MIFGWGPFPEMGVTGAAAATAISVAVSFLLFQILIFKGRLDFSLSGWFRDKPDFGAMKKIVKIGIPISTQNIVFILVYWFIIQIVHHYGDVAGAAMGIGNRMESLSYLTTFGFSMAASTLVGQNLGANKPERAAKCAWGTVSLVVIETFIISIFFIAIPRTIAGIFSSDPEVIKIAADYLIILGLSQIFMGIEITMEGAFTGAGNTIPPMLVSIPGSIARLPLAYFLCFTLDIGINGVWWTLTITSFVKAIILAVWFRKGNWKKKTL